MFPKIAPRPRFQQTTLHQIAKLATLRTPSLTQSPFLHDLDMLRIESVVVLPEHFFHREDQIHRIHELRILSIPHPSTHHAASASKLDTQQTASSRKANVCLQRWKIVCTCKDWTKDPEKTSSKRSRNEERFFLKRKRMQEEEKCRETKNERQ